MTADIITIYTDGGCTGNPGPGAWAALLIYRKKQKEITGFAPETTNNRMEMMAAVQALQCITNKKIPITLYTDSKYLMDGMNKWRHQWKKAGWKTANKQPVKNQDLWEELDTLADALDITWHWVKGHSGHPENEYVDGLVQKTIKHNKN